MWEGDEISGGKNTDRDTTSWEKETEEMRFQNGRIRKGE
jgi:hypothetical protein